MASVRVASSIQQCQLSLTLRRFSTASAIRSRPRDAGALFARASQLSESTVQGSHDIRTEVATSSSTTLGSSKATFYQKALPDGQISFSSEQGRHLFQEALRNGHMEGYFYLAEQFQTQDEPAFCGLATLAMVLNALRIDPMRAWKGSWRWFTEHNLGCGCVEPGTVHQVGMTLDMFGNLSNCNGAHAFVQRAPADSADFGALEAFTDSFRATVRATLASCEREFLVASYSRQILGQTGGGHFSPIGGYHEESDSVLIMDVARFKYPPHWTPLKELVRAMLCVDPETGRPRGYLHLRAHPRVEEPDHTKSPLHVGFVPRAAGQRLCESISGRLKSGILQIPEKMHSPEMIAMWRWLEAASDSSKILNKILMVRDGATMRDVLESIHKTRPIFKKLCNAYGELIASGAVSSFPPLRIDFDSADVVTELEMSLDTCGELWVLLVLLLPQHLRASIGHKELADPLLSISICKAVRCPWALPMAALCETLNLALPDSQANCR
eukprot:TRINITY_DN19450_c0_g1_i1.p1 TRINITY_DN19450_c0_g1~~TRINITY_DN19450_c0_g1_i1.p1  ORF type:complete len:498 (-),score=68.99 TRINITY_DN19450_c0_g1_i1:297-1790(-)